MTFLLVLIGLLGCSRKKNTFTRRLYHNTTAKYNAFFNAREIVKGTVRELYSAHKDDYSELLPLFVYPDEKKAKSLYPSMDIVIEKSSKVIDKHSMYIKKQEYVRWIDDAYMLIGKARFYKQEFYVGIEVFEYVAKAFKKDPIRNEALIWLARSHMELKEMNKAESYFTIMEDAKVPKQYNSEFNALYADFFIRKGNDDEAIIRLSKALETTTKKADRQRYSYVLAQLWLKQKEYGEASKLFTQVIKLRPEYDMMFNAKISRALAYDTQSNNKDDIKKMLRRMVKDKKNADYLDQIFFALADIAFKENDEPLGIAYLKKSVANSTSNGKQKALSYLRLGKYYYKKLQYIPAQAYYDSSLVALPKEYEYYDEIYERSKALTRLVDNLLIVQEEDSLQRMALDKSFRKKVINQLIEQAIEEENNKEETTTENEDIVFSNNTTTNRRNAAGKWYFYNPTTLGFGFSEFKKNWGNRKLEDDWRRANKQIVASFQEETNNESDTSQIANQINEKTTAEYYEQFIPLTPEKMNVSHHKIIEALYAMGNIYREDLEDYPNAIKSFEKLITKYDTCKYVLPSWYNLYRISLLIDDDILKEKYKTLIVNHYPESEYAKIIQDPTYNKVTRENRKRVNNYYSRVYDLYTDHFYKKVLIRCEKAKSIFADNHLRDQFDFLAALAVGHTKNKDAFRAALENVIKNHPQSKVNSEAKKILALINKKNETKSTDKLAEKELYEHNMGSKFIFLIVIPNSDKKINQYKIDLSTFNKKYYSASRFEPITNVFLDASNQIITVKRFNGYDNAMDYYKSVILNQDQLKEINAKGYQSFMISEENFVKFYKDKDVKAYSDFFEANFKMEG